MTLLLVSSTSLAIQLFGEPLRLTGFAYPDIGDLNQARGFLAEAEVKAKTYLRPYHLNARLLYQAYGQTPFDPDSTEGKLLGPPGGRYQNETGGGILTVERDLRDTFRAGLFGRLMNSVTYSGGADPQADPHASVFRMDSLVYGSGGLVLQAGDAKGQARVYFEWGGVAGAKRPFHRSRANGFVRLFETKPGNFTIRAFAENVGGEPPYLEAVMVGGRSTLRGYATHRYLGDQGGGVAFEWDSPLFRWKHGAWRLVLFADIARAWNRGLWADIGPPAGEDFGKSVGLGLLHIAKSPLANFPWAELDIAFGRDPWPGAQDVTFHLRLSPWGDDALGR